MKIFDGKVISTQMKNTIVVEVFRVKPHPLYRKLVKLSKKYKVDSGGEDISVGSMVRIVETKPISKDKYFKVSKVLSKGEGLLIAKDEEKVEEVLKKTTEKPAVKNAKKRTEPSDAKSSKDKKENK